MTFFTFWYSELERTVDIFAVTKHTIVQLIVFLELLDRLFLVLRDTRLVGTVLEEVEKIWIVSWIE